MGFTLDSIYLKNFMSFDELTLSFKSRGLWLLSGFNNKGKDSNGAGKTAILSGITWVLFGRTQNGLGGKDCVRWGESNCKGILTLSDKESHKYQIVRTLESLQFFIDGNEQVGHKKDLQNIINQTFGTDYSLFTTFNIFTKAWSKFITEVGDSDRKKLFKSILMLGQLDKAYEKAKGVVDNFVSQAAKAEATIKQLTNSIPELEEILNKNKELADNETKIRQATIAELERQKASLKPETEDFTAEKERINTEIEAIKAQKIPEKLEYSNIKLNNINGVIFSDSFSIEDVEKRLNAFNNVGGDCPVCGQTIPTKHRAVYKRQLEVTKKQCVESLEKNKEEKAKIEKEIYDADAEIQRARTLSEELKSLERAEWEQNLKIEKYNEFCKIADTSIEELQAPVDYTKVVELTQSKIVKIQDAIKYNTNLFNIYMKEIDVFNYLMWLYSRQGVINLIIEKCFARLKHLTNIYLHKICTEGFRLEISPQKALKSGEYRDEVDIFIWDKTKKIPYQSLSSGQQQRINMAMLVALYMFGKELGANNFDFILLDEIIDLSLAEAGQEAALELLYSLKDKIFHTVVITHKEGLKGRFDKEINVIRGEDGISRLSG